ncbi:MAG: TIGR02300 family protein [Stellaceae bacterium]
MAQRSSDPARDCRGFTVAKPEWGTKRICPSCGTRYYDLMREQVICPRCNTPFDPEAFLKARRARPALPVEKEAAPVGTEEIETEGIEETEEEEEEGETAPLEDAEEEDEELIEDASELGEDEDDMAEVIDNVEEEES